MVDDEVIAVPRTVSESQFEPRALAYLCEVEETGEPLILTDRGRPVLRIAPYAPAAETLASLRGCVVRYDAAGVGDDHRPASQSSTATGSGLLP